MARYMPKRPATTFDAVPWERCAGVEFETTHPNLEHLVSSKVVYGEHCGSELLSVPAMGDSLLDELRICTNILQNHGCCVSRECGGHVHIDISDFTWKDMARLTAAYHLVQDALYELMPSSREHGTSDHYSVKYRRTQDRSPQEFISNLVDDDEDEAAVRVYAKLRNTAFETARARYGEVKNGAWDRYSPPRYRGMNLQNWTSWYLHGDGIPTVEFRFPTATTQYERAKGVVLLLLALVEYAKNTSLEEIKNELGGVDLLLRLAIDDDVRSFIFSRYDYYLRHTDCDEWCDDDYDSDYCHNCDCSPCECGYCCDCDSYDCECDVERF